MLDLDALTVLRDGREVISGVTLSVGPGEIVGLIGPNGAGKTTLLRAALGLLPARGRSSLAALRPAERARRAAFLPQGREIAWPMPVEAVVALGRLSHPARAGADDRAAVDAAIAALNLGALRHRAATSLSGGEQARVLIARALAQGTPLLVADEPIAGLDPAAQIEVMRLFRHLAGEGRSVIASLHDLGLAARHCTRLLLLHQGRITADGPPRAVLTPALMARVFGVSVHAEDSPAGLIVQPLDIMET